MGTLTVGLSFTSPAGDIATDALAMTLTDNLTTTTPNVGVSRMTALLASPTNILTAAAAPTTTYLYLKNTDSVNIVVVKTDAAVGMVDLAPGEFMFMPLKGAVGVEVQGAGGDCITEYAFWTKG
jgi:hypothetical protein|tara:strand:+ start:154 stop:525 length:372 start_codon:yes stop_codon:yes gene_type:complete